jgi:Ion channel
MLACMREERPVGVFVRDVYLAAGRHLRHLDSYVLVLLMLAGTFVFIMATPPEHWASLTALLLESATLLLALRVSRAKRRMVNLCRVIVVLAVVSAIVTMAQGGQPESMGFIAMIVAAVGPIVVLRGLRRRSTTIDRETVAAALCIYLMMGLFFASLYGGIVSSDPDAFKGLDVVDSSSLLYFGFITQATVGYGDITPASDLARALAVVQSVLGQLYLVTVVALVVGNIGRAVPRGTRKDEGP